MKRVQISTAFLLILGAFIKCRCTLPSFIFCLLLNYTPSTYLNAKKKEGGKRWSLQNKVDDNFPAQLKKAVYQMYIGGAALCQFSLEVFSYSRYHNQSFVDIHLEFIHYYY